jgi:Xaa-Pro aminopeptidase
MSFWPSPSPNRAFVERRSRLLAAFKGSAVIASGLARVRNMQSSYFPFRAESHFLYLVGRHLEGALLLLHEGAATLYVSPPEAQDELWMGPEPSVQQLSEQCGLPVRPMTDFVAPDVDLAVLAPQDTDTADWLAAQVDRPLEAGGDPQSEEDLALGDAMIELRMIHDTAALDQMTQAAHVTELAHLAGLRALRPGAREAAVRAAMEAEIVAHGMIPAYPSIVTVHGEVLHNERHEGLLQAGDLLLADVGAETPEGWASDVTRTWPVTGSFSSSQRAIYELVLLAQQAAIESVAPQVRYRDVHRVAAKKLLAGLVGLGIFKGDVEELYALGAAGVFFPHGVGHLLGLDVHDLDDLGDRATYAPGRERSQQMGERYLRLDRDLQPNMVVTIEPGFYQVPSILNGTLPRGVNEALNRSELAKYSDVRGIRIEDDVRVTADGREVLTRSIPKSVSEIEAVSRQAISNQAISSHGSRGA